MNLFRRLIGGERARPPLSERIDLDDPVVSIDPFPAYERLRAEGDVVHLSRHDAWLVLGYGAAKEVFADPARFSSAPYAFIDRTLLSADPPNHASVRRLVSRRFGGETLRRLEVLATETAEALLRPDMEAVGDFARPVSRTVAADLIGFGPYALGAIAEAEDEAARSPAQDSFARICARIDDVAPSAGMFSELRREAPDLDPEQAGSLVRLLWLASSATTERTIAQCILCLTRDPELSRRLREDPGLVPAFVEEVVRLNPPENLIRRRAVGATSLAGTAIPAGAEVNLCLPAANRDPAVFEAADSLRLDRPGTANLSFGNGIHFCVGAPMTRRVIAAAMTMFLRRSEGLRLAGEVEWLHAMMVRAPRTLRVSL